MSALLEIDNRRTHMSYADHIFINMCKDIIENGTSTEGEKVRPKWEDGTSAYTIKQFGVVNRYDLSKEFPALTLRRTAIKSCTDEMLWIQNQRSFIITSTRNAPASFTPARAFLVLFKNIGKGKQLYFPSCSRRF